MRIAHQVRLFTEVPVREPAVSVVLSTFNRSRSVPATLEHLLSQTVDPDSYEIIVVDNNSTDSTAAVVKGIAARAPRPIRYVFEPRQGLPNARNAGIAAARAAVVAFTDDDVRVSKEWVREIAQAFGAHPEVECVGGRTLPVWPSTPPRWLTSLHWVGPLALQDYGDQPFMIDARRPLCLAGANFAFRKSLFGRIGGFSTEFPRAQDTELLVRMWRAGGGALYVPTMTVHAEVQPERLTKRYHRRWHSNIGRWNARMQLEELLDPVLGLRDVPKQSGQIFGTPAFACRQIARETWNWVRHAVAGREAEAFLHENRVRVLVGYIREWRAMQRAGEPHAAAARTVETAPQPLSARSET